MSVDHITRTEINIGAISAPLVARVNRRAKKLIVKVDPVTGEILVTAPSKRTLPDAIAFAHERADWIAGQMKNAVRARPFVPDAVIPYGGVDHVIVQCGGPRAPVRVCGIAGDDGAAPDRPAIRVGGAAEHVNRRLTDWLKKQARQRLIERTDDYSARLGRKRGPVRVRDMRTRWGSCTADGAMSFSWRLILTPPEILDYVAAHECAHLVHMDHSPAFWSLLATLDVDARAAAAWFREQGQILFAYGVSG